MWTMLLGGCSWCLATDERKRMICLYPFLGNHSLCSQTALTLFERGPHAGKRHHKQPGQLQVGRQRHDSLWRPSSLRGAESQMLFISSDFWPNEVHSVDTAGGFTGAETGSCWLLGNAVCLQSMENSHGEIFFLYDWCCGSKASVAVSRLAKRLVWWAT